MPAFSSLSKCVPVLAALARQAYRSLHFYDADTISTTVLSLGELRIPPRDVHAFVLSFLTALPNFHRGKHVAHLLKGLSGLNVRHPVLTAHLLKIFLRCYRGGAVRGRGKEIVEGEAQVVCLPSDHRDSFFASFVSILQTLYMYGYSVQLIRGLFLSIEEFLREGCDLSPPCGIRGTYRQDNCCFNSGSGANADGLVVDRFGYMEGGGDPVFFVLLLFLKFFCPALGGAVHLERVDAYLEPLVDRLHHHLAVSLLISLNQQPSRWESLQHGTVMSRCQRRLIYRLVQCFRSCSTPFVKLSIDQIITLLRYAHHLRGDHTGKQGAEGELLYAMNRLRTHLEGASLSLNQIRTVAEGGLMLWGDMAEGDSFTKIHAAAIRTKISLVAVFHMLQKSEEGRGGKSMRNVEAMNTNWQKAGSLISLCHYGFMSIEGRSNDTGEPYTPSFEGLCNLTCKILGELYIGDGVPHISSVRQLHKVIGPLKELLAVRVGTSTNSSRKGCAFMLLEALERYEIRAINFFGIQGCSHDADLICLCTMLQDSSLQRGTCLSVIDVVLPNICRRRSLSSDSIEPLVHVLRMLLSDTKNRCSRKWYESIVESERLSTAASWLCVAMAAVKNTAGSSAYFITMFSLLTVICPIERRSARGGEGVDIFAVRIPRSCRVLCTVKRLFHNCRSLATGVILNRAGVRSSGSDHFYSALFLPAKSVAERCALQSRFTDLCRTSMTPAPDSDDQSEECCGECDKEQELKYDTCVNCALRCNILDFFVWLGAFRYAVIQRTRLRNGGGVEGVVTDVHEIRQPHAELLNIVSSLLEDLPRLNASLRRAVLVGFYMEAQCEALERSNTKPNSMGAMKEAACAERQTFMRHSVFLRVVPLFIGELFHNIAIRPMVGSDIGQVTHDAKTVPYAQMTHAAFHNAHTTHNVGYKEITFFLSQFFDEFGQCKEFRHNLCALHDVVWDSLTCITSLCSSTGRWIEEFRHSKVFSTSNLCGNNDSVSRPCLKGMKDDMVIAHPRNTLLWSLLLLTCFIRYRCIPRESDGVGAEWLTAAEVVASRIVLMVSDYTPPLRRKRPAPETFVALHLREAMERRFNLCNPGLVSDTDRRITCVLDEVLHREAECLKMWEPTFPCIAARVRRCWKST
ncbi:hypothetical protein, conserved [Trypanosoma brucei gambiense DAL972]|uniref:Uncharacterized protein n=1 Tax=Trypanosoma brucei gambiense (strain MHOM/CI/86/DAL972) TaxID=679716 RepID=D0A5V1_TRYB9|nr:hypothetical protein, conserved [Trypanosoma brucei gambiense DAL972]CBH17052.1 hypothetical protein, conserved [Trypanosoma brucei gambiense DAL972]|eukprot:XP_011779316.1 hypothetical protein, conserved [Trypanosoma brucei gambiense DAL972]